MASAFAVRSGRKSASGGIRCLVTAGPTREYLDPVRFLSNASSGKMGFALAEKAAILGWEVELVSGPVSLRPPRNVRIHRVVSAVEMLAAVEPLFRWCDILFMVAAVADYRPAECASEKMKKSKDRLSVKMVRNPDILKHLAALRTHQTVVGFAAESQHLEDYAAEKLVRKGMDWIVANDISRPGLGMEVDDNEIVLMSSSGVRMPFGPAPKEEVAAFILEQVRGAVGRPARK
ncbi:MAG: phosphopantothenoylcysteine decarboxylase [Opitutaceae bacterium]